MAAARGPATGGTGTQAARCCQWPGGVGPRRGEGRLSQAFSPSGSESESLSQRLSEPQTLSLSLTPRLSFRQQVSLSQALSAQSQAFSPGAERTEPQAESLSLRLLSISDSESLALIHFHY